MELVIGRAGHAHISAADLASMYRGMFGDEDRVLPLDSNMDCTVLDANTVEIGTGGCMLQAHFARVETAEQVKIESGAPGYKRNDILVARYTLGDGNIQDTYLAVLKGVATVGTPEDPPHAEGDIDSGAILVEFPLWRIPIDGVNVGTPERIMPIASSMKELGDSISLKKKTVTGTTSDYGNVQLGLLVDGAVVLVVIGVYGSNQIWIPYVENDRSWRAHGVQTNSSHTPVANKSVSLTVWYKED